jgi:hypothetical protein
VLKVNEPADWQRRSRAHREAQAGAGRAHDVSAT